MRKIIIIIGILWMAFVTVKLIDQGAIIRETQINVQAIASETTGDHY